MVKERNVVLVLIFTLITFGIYGIYWLYATSTEMKELGAEDAPSPIMILLVFIPIANLYYIWKYSKATESISQGRVNGILYFILWIIIGFVAIILTQLELNKHVGGASPQVAAAEPEQPVAESEEPAQPEQPQEPQV